MYRSHPETTSLLPHREVRLQTLPHLALTIDGAQKALHDGANSNAPPRRLLRSLHLAALSQAPQHRVVRACAPYCANPRPFEMSQKSSARQRLLPAPQPSKRGFPEQALVSSTHGAARPAKPLAHRAFQENQTRPRPSPSRPSGCHPPQSAKSQAARDPRLAHAPRGESRRVRACAYPKAQLRQTRCRYDLWLQ